MEAKWLPNSPVSMTDSNPRCSSRTWHKILWKKRKCESLRIDLIGGQRGGFKSGCEMWLRISPLSMTGLKQIFEEKMA